MLENKDLIVIANLRENARAKLTDISRKTSIPTSTIYDKIKYFEGSIINRFTLLLNFEALGFNTRVSILIKVSNPNKEPFKEYIIKHRAVNSVFRINSDYDFLIEAVFKQLKDAEDFINNIENRFQIDSKKVNYIIDDLKREGFLSSPIAFKLLGI